MNTWWIECKKATKAGINCNRRCDSCGWNPEEKARRLSEGDLRTHFKVMDGRIYTVKVLHFKPRNGAKKQEVTV